MEKKKNLYVCHVFYSKLLHKFNFNLKERRESDFNSKYIETCWGAKEYQIRGAFLSNYGLSLIHRTCKGYAIFWCHYRELRKFPNRKATFFCHLYYTLSVKCDTILYCVCKQLLTECKLPTTLRGRTLLYLPFLWMWGVLEIENCYHWRHYYLYRGIQI